MAKYTHWTHTLQHLMAKQKSTLEQTLPGAPVCLTDETYTFPVTLQALDIVTRSNKYEFMETKHNPLA